MSAPGHAFPLLHHQFSAICRARIKVIGFILARGHDVFWLDTDIVVLRDLNPLLVPAAAQDVEPRDGTHTIGRVVGPQQPGYGWDYAINYYVNHSNAAFYFLRSNPRTIQFMDNWNQCIKKVASKKVCMPLLCGSGGPPGPVGGR